MPYSRLTFSQIQANVAADIASSVPGADGLLRYSNLGVLGQLMAAYQNGMYGYLDWIALQSTPFTATDVGLEAWAGLKGVIRKGAQASTGEVTFPAVGGPTVPAGSVVQRGDGALFSTTADAVAAGGSVTVSAVAQVAGAAGSLILGQAMTLGTPVAGVTSQGAVTLVVNPGIDVELDLSLRSRMLQVYANPPMGGASSDYQRWALQVPGVTRAWVVPEGVGPGSVSVLFMMDVAEALHNGFPQGSNGGATLETRLTVATGDQLTVANAIYPLAPVIARNWLGAPGQNTVNFTIAGIAGAPAGVKASISAAIASVFLAQGAPDGVTAVDLSYINSAIGAIAGSAGFVITAMACSHGAISPGPEGNITSSTGYLPVLGAVAYV